MELNESTLAKFKDYKKILFYLNPVDYILSYCQENNISNIEEFINNDVTRILPLQTEYLNIEWIDQVIDTSNLNSFIKKYSSLSYNFEKLEANKDIEKKICKIYKNDYEFIEKV